MKTVTGNLGIAAAFFGAAIAVLMTLGVLYFGWGYPVEDRLAVRLWGGGPTFDFWVVTAIAGLVALGIMANLFDRKGA